MSIHVPQIQAETSRALLFLLLFLVVAIPSSAQSYTGTTYNGRQIMWGHVPGDLRPGGFVENVILIQVIPGKAEQDLTVLLAAHGGTIIKAFGEAISQSFLLTNRGLVDP